MDPSYSDLNKYAENIFSDDKNIRIKFRKKILENSELFDICKFKAKKIKEYSFYYLVSQAINEFVNHDEFIFKIKEKPGVILESKSKKNSSTGIPVLIPADLKEPVFLATMPHLAGEKNNLIKQIELLKEEGFDTSTKKSIEIAKNRLFIFVGVNYCDTLDPEINKPKKQYIEDLLRKEKISNVAIEAFRWQCVWGYAKKTIAIETSKKKPGIENRFLFVNKDVPQTTVKRIFKLLKELNSKKASKLFKEIMKKKVIPYQDIRERVKGSVHVKDFFNSYRLKSESKPCYFFICDDDAVALRNDEKGVFSHYDDLIKKYPKLEVASTGYFMDDPKNNSVKTITQTFLVAKQAMALRIPNAAYLSEANIIVKIPDGKKISKSISFLRKNNNEGNAEALGLLENLELMKDDVRGRVITGTKGSIQTGVSPNVKACSKLNFKPKDLIINENLQTFRSFSQSPLKPLSGFAMNVMRTVPGSKNTFQNRKFLISVYQAFDPIEYSQLLPECWLEAHPLIVNKIVKGILSGLDNRLSSECYKNFAIEIVDEIGAEKKYIKKFAEIIKEKVHDIFEAEKGLVNKKIMDLKSFTNILRAALDISSELFSHLKNLIESKNCNKKNHLLVFKKFYLRAGRSLRLFPCFFCICFIVSECKALEN